MCPSTHLLSLARATFLPVEVCPNLELVGSRLSGRPAGNIGSDGIKLWDIKLHKELACSNFGSYGAISCAIWIKTKYGSTETLCYGTALGYLVFLRSSPAIVGVVIMSYVVGYYSEL